MLHRQEALEALSGQASEQGWGKGGRKGKGKVGGSSLT